MSAIIRTTEVIVNSALELVGLFNPNDSIPGYLLDDGLKWLNLRLDHWQANARLIPYFHTEEFNTEAGVGTYEIEDFTTIAQMRLISDSVSYPIEVINYFQLDDIVYNATIEGRPYICIMQNFIDTASNAQKTRLRLYVVPNRVYTVKITGKKPITLLKGQDILNELPNKYHLFLISDLARTLVSVYRKQKRWTPILESDYVRMRNDLMASSDIELSADGNRGQLQMPYTGYRYSLHNLGVSA